MNTETTTDVTEETKAKTVYKKTGRTRTTKGHEKVERSVDEMQQQLSCIVDPSIKMGVERSSLERFARALFKISIENPNTGDNVTIDGLTGEEIMTMARMTRVIYDLKLPVDNEHDREVPLAA